MKITAIGLVGAALCLAVALFAVLRLSTEESAAAAQMVDQYVTFYSWLDNDPPSSAIAYSRTSHSRTVHESAGGTGTYADPITTATDPTAWAVGTRMYAPFLRKYLVIEDWCASCVQDWRQSRRRHIDVWLNSNATTGEAVHQCAYRWTQETAPIEINPPRNRPVDTRPLFDTSTNTCLESTFASGFPFRFSLWTGGHPGLPWW